MQFHGKHILQGERLGVQVKLHTSELHQFLPMPNDNIVVVEITKEQARSQGISAGAAGRFFALIGYMNLLTI